MLTVTTSQIYYSMWSYHLKRIQRLFGCTGCKRKKKERIDISADIIQGGVKADHVKSIRYSTNHKRVSKMST